MNRTSLVLEREGLRKESKACSDRIEAIKKRQVQIEDALRVPDGLDNAKLLVGSRLIYVGGSPTWTDYAGMKRGSERMGCLRDAMVAIAHGGGDLRTSYFATKDYDRWSDQREDHTYGFGPRHGHIVFRVELQREPRSRESLLTEDEREACLYALQLIRDGKLTGDQLEVIRRETAA